MKFCVMSDTHMTHLELKMPEADYLIHCGDGLDWGTEDELIRLNAWFGKLNYKKILYIPGNHDIIIGEDPYYASELMNNATILIDELIEIDGKQIYGSPWTPTYGNWEFMKPDLNLASHWEAIPEGVDILITHGPPYGILDKNYRGELCGSQTLMKAVLDKYPSIHCFGHLHESYGQYHIEPTTFMNVACPINYDGSRNRHPTVFEI